MNYSTRPKPVQNLCLFCAAQCKLLTFNNKHSFSLSAYKHDLCQSVKGTFLETLQQTQLAIQVQVRISKAVFRAVLIRVGSFLSVKHGTRCSFAGGGARVNEPVSVRGTRRPPTASAADHRRRRRDGAVRTDAWPALRSQL